MDAETRALMETAPDSRIRETTYCSNHGRLEPVWRVLGAARFRVERTTPGREPVLTDRHAAEVRVELRCGCVKRMVGGDWWKPSR